jgi:hypothetical protein
LDNGKLVRNNWSSRTNNPELAKQWAIANREKLLAEYYNKHKNGKLDNLASAFGAIHCYSENHRSIMCCYAAESCACEGKHDEAYQYFEQACDYNDTSRLAEFDKTTYETLLKALGGISEHLVNFEKLAKYCNAVAKTKDIDKIELFNAMLVLLYQKAKANGKDGEFALYAGKFSDLGFFGAMKAVANSSYLLQMYINDLAANFDGIVHNYFGIVFYEAIKRNLDISLVLDKFNCDNVQVTLQGIASNSCSGDEFAKLIAIYVVPDKFVGSVKQLFWAMTALEQAVLLSRNLSKDEKAVLFNNFFHVVSVLVSNVYNPALFNEDDIGILPKLHRFGYYLAAAQNAQESGDTGEYTAALNAALREYPEMKNLIDFLIVESVSRA